MATKRVPISRGGVRTVTPRAIEAFRKMQHVWQACTCPHRQPCAACEEWWQAHSVLHRELRLPSWWWPAVEPPDAECPYPAGSEAAKWWIKQRSGRLDAINLHNALVAHA